MVYLMLFLQRNPVDIQDTIMRDDVKDSSTSKDVSLKAEQSGYMSMLKIVDDLKHSTERYIGNNAVCSVYIYLIW